jgi:hypothetical protein
LSFHMYMWFDHLYYKIEIWIEFGFDRANNRGKCRENKSLEFQ